MYSIDTRRDILDEDFGEVVVTVGPDPDGLDMVVMTAPDTGARIAIPADASQVLVDAICKCSKEIQENKRLRESRLSESLGA